MPVHKNETVYGSARCNGLFQHAVVPRVCDVEIAQTVDRDTLRPVQVARKVKVVTDVAANIQLLFHHQLVARIGKEQIARAYAMLKNDTQSQREYAAFFRVWKDADSSLPIFRRAHREYGQIKSRCIADLRRWFPSKNGIL